MFFDLKNALFDLYAWQKRRMAIIVIGLSIFIVTIAAYLYNLVDNSLTLLILDSLIYLALLIWCYHREKCLISAITDYLIRITKLKRETLEEAYQVITKRYDATEIAYQPFGDINVTFVRDDCSAKNSVDIMLSKRQLKALYSSNWKLLVIEETIKTIPDEVKEHLRKSFGENPSDWLLKEKEEEEALEAYLRYMRDHISFEKHYLLEELDSDVHLSDSSKQFLDKVAGVPAFQLRPIKSYRVITILK